MGQISLRIGDAAHSLLKTKAAEQRTSVNDLIVKAIAHMYTLDFKLPQADLDKRRLRFASNGGPYRDEMTDAEFKEATRLWVAGQVKDGDPVPKVEATPTPPADVPRKKSKK